MDETDASKEIEEILKQDQATVLIIDDQPLELKTLAGILDQDYRVKVAQGGEDGLVTAVSQRPDIILLDIQMPDLDGFEICRRLKSVEILCDIPIIFVTVMGSELDEEKGLRLGAVDYITKPYRPAVVKARVDAHLRRSRAEKALAAKIIALKEALTEIRTLRGIVPICSRCKKIRTENNTWTEVEVYVSEHSESEFSHSLCPDCVRKLYPDMADELLANR